MIRYPIVHNLCGTQVLWYIGPMVLHNLIKASDITYLDGTPLLPDYPLRCPRCKYLLSLSSVQRQLDKPEEYNETTLQDC